jgi:predicted DNA binding CopG/RHH family protein
MSERIIVFRVSNWFLERINKFCRKEGISYKELFERAIDLLCKKYLEDSDEEGKDGRREDRDSSE